MSHTVLLRPDLEPLFPSLGGAREYRMHLHNGSYPALAELSDSLTGDLTCLLCFEGSHDVCHRAVIAGAVAERLPRVAIVHL